MTEGEGDGDGQYERTGKLISRTERLEVTHEEDINKLINN